jgi:hypothetical protein
VKERGKTSARLAATVVADFNILSGTVSPFTCSNKILADAGPALIWNGLLLPGWS